MFNFKKLFEKENFVLVKTFRFEVVNSEISTEEGTLHVHCLESNKGNRKVDMKCSISNLKSTAFTRWANSNDFYQKTIYRWLSGRKDPEIPTFSQIGEEDTANFLRGKIG